MKPRFRDEQIIQMKEEEAGAHTEDVCRRYRMSQSRFYKYMSKYGSMEPSDAKRLRTLATENAKLKKLLAEQMLENAILREVNTKSGDA